jgi:nucleoside-diphosphate-sugar epimerase
MKIFVTGATGYIGTVVVEHAVRAGHVVEGLARSAERAARVSALGATPVMGDLESHEVLTTAASRADATLHLAYIHDFSLDHSIVIDTEIKAVTALAKGAGGKPIITTSGTALAAPSPDGRETDETAPICEGFVLSKRIVAERAALDLAKKGAHVVSVRLPQYVYGRGGSFFVPLLMRQAAKHGVSAWIEGPVKRTSDVDVDDVARFYLAAADRARAGSLYICTGETDVTTRQLAEAIGQALDVPSRGLPRAEVEALWGPFLTAFVDYENRASSAKAQRELGWRPRAKYGLLADITTGSYKELARQLRQQHLASLGQTQKGATASS